MTLRCAFFLTSILGWIPLSMPGNASHTAQAPKFVAAQI